MAIQEIDFLPASYRQMQIRRCNTRWRRGALAIFVLLIAAGTAGQYRIRKNLEVTRGKLVEHQKRMLAQLDDPAELQQRIARLDARAHLLTFLKIRVPPTRLLQGLTNSLPEYVTLNQIDVKFEPLPPPPAPPGGQPLPPVAASPAAPAAPKLPQEKDLAELRKSAEGSALFVSIVGRAPHDNAIARYIESLQKTGLFAEVRLLYTDQLLVEELNLRRFAMRLRIKQPSGRPQTISEPSINIPGPTAAVESIRARPGPARNRHEVSTGRSA